MHGNRDVETNRRDIGMIDDLEALRSRCERLERTALLWRTIREVVRMGIGKWDLKRLAKDVCGVVVENRGYRSAWMALYSSDGRLDVFAEKQVGPDFERMVERLQSDVLPECVNTALNTMRLAVVSSPLKKCPSCPLFGQYGDRSAFTAPLLYEDCVYGFFCVSLPFEFTAEKEERRLFEELAKELACSLKNHHDNKKARQWERRYNHIINSLPYPMSFVGLDYRYEAVNEAYTQVFGASRDEIAGQTVAALLGDEDFQKKVRPRLDRCFKGERVQYEDWFEAIDGSSVYRQMTYSPHIDDEGKVEGAVVHAYDLTMLKSYQSRLAESNRRFMDIAEVSGDWIWEADADLRITYSSDGVEKMLGIAALDAVGKRLPELFSGGKNDEFASDVPPAFDGGAGTVELSVRATHADGRGLYVETKAIPVFDKKGDLSGYIGASRDVTEKRAMENELRHAQKMEAIGNLAGGIAHEFNNVLGIIIGNIDLAEFYLSEDSAAKSCMDEIKGAGLRGRDIVKQLLNFSRKMEYEKTPLDLRPLVKESLKLMRASIPAIVRIRRNIAEKVDSITADATRLNQLIINLCTNAAQAIGEDGGNIVVELENVRLSSEEACRYPELAPGRYVRLSVIDDGPGIAPDLVDKVFEPYFTTKEQGKGTGMGLAVVHGIVKAHDGAVRIESRPGKGTAFRVLFPSSMQDADEDKTKRKRRTTKELPKGNESVLFIDDEKSIARMYKTILSRLGYRVTAETNPLQALRRFEAAPDDFDLVVSDISMPDMSGDKLAKKLLEIRPGLPIIVCTGYSETISEKRAAEMGIRGFLMKPVDKAEMASLAREVLDGGGSSKINARRE